MSDNYSYLFRATFHRQEPQVSFIATEKEEPILTENDEMLQVENQQENDENS